MIDQGFNGCLQPLIEHYGVEILELATSAPTLSQNNVSAAALILKFT